MLVFPGLHLLQIFYPVVPLSYHRCFRDPKFAISKPHLQNCSSPLNLLPSVAPNPFSEYTAQIFGSDSMVITEYLNRKNWQFQGTEE